MPIYKHQVNECKIENSKEVLSEIMLNLVKNWNLTDNEKRCIAKQIGIYYLINEREDMTSKEFSKLNDELQKMTVVCDCTCKVKFTSTSPDSLICQWCGKRVYRNSQIEFREKLKKKMKEG